MTRTILHDAALADGSSDSLRLGVSVAVADGRVESIGANDEIDRAGAEVIDAGGAVIVPGMVDCHSHLTMQGGSHWIARGDDPPPVLRQVPPTVQSFPNQHPAAARRGLHYAAPRSTARSSSRRARTTIGTSIN